MPLIENIIYIKPEDDELDIKEEGLVPLSESNLSTLKLGDLLQPSSLMEPSWNSANKIEDDPFASLDCPLLPDLDAQEECDEMDIETEILEDSNYEALQITEDESSHLSTESNDTSYIMVKTGIWEMLPKAQEASQPVMMQRRCSERIHGQKRNLEDESYKGSYPKVSQPKMKQRSQEISQTEMKQRRRSKRIHTKERYLEDASSIESYRKASKPKMKQRSKETSQPKMKQRSKETSQPKMKQRSKEILQPKLKQRTKKTSQLKMKQRRRSKRISTQERYSEGASHMESYPKDFPRNPPVVDLSEELDQEKTTSSPSPANIIVRPIVCNNLYIIQPSNLQSINTFRSPPQTQNLSSPFYSHNVDPRLSHISSNLSNKSNEIITLDDSSPAEQLRSTLHPCPANQTPNISVTSSKSNLDQSSTTNNPSDITTSEILNNVALQLNNTSNTLLASSSTINSSSTHSSSNAFPPPLLSIRVNSPNTHSDICNNSNSSPISNNTHTAGSRMFLLNPISASSQNLDSPSSENSPSYLLLVRSTNAPSNTTPILSSNNSPSDLSSAPDCTKSRSVPDTTLNISPVLNSDNTLSGISTASDNNSSHSAINTTSNISPVLNSNNTLSDLSSTPDNTSSRSAFETTLNTSNIFNSNNTPPDPSNASNFTNSSSALHTTSNISPVLNSSNTPDLSSSPHINNSCSAFFTTSNIYPILNSNTTPNLSSAPHNTNSVPAFDNNTNKSILNSNDTPSDISSAPDCTNSGSALHSFSNTSPVLNSNKPTADLSSRPNCTNTRSAFDSTSNTSILNSYSTLDLSSPPDCNNSLSAFDNTTVTSILNSNKTSTDLSSAPDCTNTRSDLDSISNISPLLNSNNTSSDLSSAPDSTNSSSSLDTTSNPSSILNSCNTPELSNSPDYISSLPTFDTTTHISDQLLMDSSLKSQDCSSQNSSSIINLGENTPDSPKSTTDTDIEETATSECAIEDKIEEKVKVVMDTCKSRWGKKNHCLYCLAFLSKLPRHLERKHKTEVLVAEALSYPRKSKDRLYILEKIRNEGNFQHNMEILNTGNGNLTPVNRKERKSSPSSYMPCPGCKGFFLRKNIWLHKRKCKFLTTAQKSKRITRAGLDMLSGNNELKFKENKTFSVNEGAPRNTNSRSVFGNTSNMSTTVSSNNTPEVSSAPDCINSSSSVDTTSNPSSILNSSNTPELSSAPDSTNSLPTFDTTHISDHLLLIDSTSISQGCSNQNSSSIINLGENTTPGSSKSTAGSITMCNFGNPSGNEMEDVDNMNIEENDETNEGSAIQDKIKEKVKLVMDTCKRRWCKKNHCLYCSEFITKLPRHLERKHKTEVLVAEALSYPCKSKDRSYILEKIRKEGNFQHNMEILSIGNGTLTPVSRKGRMSSPRSYMPCPGCKGFFLKKSFWLHKKNCKFLTTAQKSRRIMGASLDMLSGDNELKSQFKESVIFPMNQDEITHIVKNDKLICQFGEKLYSNHLYQSNLNYIRQRLRLTAKLLKELRRTNSSIVSLSDAIDPSHFATIIESVRQVSGFDYTASTFKNPSLPFKLGDNLKMCAKIVQIQSLKSRDTTKEQKSKDFLTLIQDDWSDELSKNAPRTEENNDESENFFSGTEKVSRWINQNDYFFETQAEHNSEKTLHLLLTKKEATAATPANYEDQTNIPAGQSVLTDNDDMTLGPTEKESPKEFVGIQHIPEVSAVGPVIPTSFQDEQQLVQENIPPSTPEPLSELFRNEQIIQQDQEIFPEPVNVEEARDVLLPIHNLGCANTPIKERQNTKSQSRRASVQSGKSYTNSKGRVVDAKAFRDVTCNCRLKCSEKLPLEVRKEIFTRFWGLSNWQAQETFIVNNIKTTPILRRTTSTPNSRMTSRKFYLNEIALCKETFLNTLAISNHRMDYALRIKNKHGFISPDKRGGNAPNKTSNQSLDKVKEFLNSFPKYTSHYSLTPRQYFHPELTVRKLHELYTSEQINNGGESGIISYRVFLSLFKKYNVAIYIPKKDTCQLCDRLNIQLTAATGNEEKNSIEKQQQVHLKKADYARQYLNNKSAESKSDESMLVFTFDLEKTQPIPYLNTSVVFYKRQMWLYNLGINSRKSNKGYMCLWTENEGKRGANEVSSCIFSFLKCVNMTSVKKLISFSDGCGGQNRNKTLIAFMYFVVEFFELDSWEHSYLESGHTFLPNDSDFAKIESQKKKADHIYTFDDWKRKITLANNKQPFEIIEMKGNFLNTKSLQTGLCFRGKDSNGDAFSWLKLRWLQIEKGSGEMKFKTSHAPDSEAKSIDFTPRKGIKFPKQLPPLTTEVKLSYEKYKDILSLLPYIPPIHHEYFTSLPHETAASKKSKDTYPELDSDDEA